MLLDLVTKSDDENPRNREIQKIYVTTELPHNVNRAIFDPDFKYKYFAQNIQSFPILD